MKTLQVLTIISVCVNTLGFVCKNTLMLQIGGFSTMIFGILWFAERFVYIKMPQNKEKK